MPAVRANFFPAFTFTPQPVMANNMAHPDRGMSPPRIVTVCPNCLRNTMVVMYIRESMPLRRKRQVRIGQYCKTCHHAIIDAVEKKREAAGHPYPLSTT